MTIGGWIFMILSITLVVGLTAWCYYRVLTTPSPERTTEPPETLGG
jgi:hypothetical protein